jgi:DNA modification methylase
MAWQLYQGDCLEVLKQYPDSYFDSIVTDPPYELGFMGKKWDSTGIAYNVELWQEVLRVLKPGGYLLSFGGTRTYHRMACAIEDAGFEIRDQIQWIYGSGFPKSMDISKAIDKKAGVKREGIIKTNGAGVYIHSETINDGRSKQAIANSKNKQIYETGVPVTHEAQLWDGWGTCLKPANEPIVVARKPISEKTIADNVLKWGTGGINIDGCRIELQEEGEDKRLGGKGTWKTEKMAKNVYKGGYSGEGVTSSKLGRFPANVIFDEEAGKMLDGQSGISKSTGGTGEKSKQWDNGVIGWKGQATGGFGDTGGASRFFYCAKASKKERGDSKHPTVKPLSLMRYLCRLITPPEGIILDPFAGSGTTLEAAILEGFNVVGIEKEHDYIPDIRRRIERAQLNTQALEMDLFLTK